MQRDSEITFGNFKALKVSFSLCSLRVPCTSVGIFSPSQTRQWLQQVLLVWRRNSLMWTLTARWPLHLSLENCPWLAGGASCDLQWSPRLAYAQGINPSSWLRVGKFCTAIHAADSPRRGVDSETGRGQAQPWKEWHGHCRWTWHKLVEATKSKTAGNVTSGRPQASVYTHCNTSAYAKWHTHGAMPVPRLTIKGQEVGGDPMPGTPPPFPPNSWNNLPTHQPMKLLNCFVLFSC